MSEWAVTEEALAAMETAGAAMEETTEKIQADIDALKSAFEDNAGGLGAHSQDIMDLIEELEQIGKDASTPVKKLILKLAKSILIRRKHMEENKYKGKSR